MRCRSSDSLDAARRRSLRGRRGSRRRAAGECSVGQTRARPPCRASPCRPSLRRHTCAGQERWRRQGAVRHVDPGQPGGAEVAGHRAVEELGARRRARRSSRALDDARQPVDKDVFMRELDVLRDQIEFDSDAECSVEDRFVTQSCQVQEDSNRGHLLFDREVLRPGRRRSCSRSCSWPRSAPRSRSSATSRSRGWASRIAAPGPGSSRRSRTATSTRRAR